MSGPELRVDAAALTWDPAEVTVPAVPAAGGGPDPLSALVAATLPTVATDVTTNVAKTRAREEAFAANLAAARSAYQGTDGAGGSQINAAANGMADAGSPPASSPATSAAGPPAGDAGFSQLSQLMGMAMQVGQQAVQAPMQAVGAVGQMAGQAPQTVMQGVQGIVQQASQASEKAAGKDVADGAGAHNGGANIPAGDQQREPGEEKPEVKKDYEEADEEKKKDELAAGTDAGSSERAPVGGPQTEPSSPGEVPRHRRLTETSPEVAL